MSMYLIMGRVGSGKNYFADLLNNQGLRRVVSRTTRKKRSHEDKDNYIWVKKEKALKETDRLAETKIAGNLYYILKKDLTNKDLYIIDPRGMYELTKNTPDIDYHIIYIEADSHDSRKKHALQREKDKEKAEKKFDKREKSEAGEFNDFEKVLNSKNPYEKLPFNVQAIHILHNNYENGDYLKKWAINLAQDKLMRQRLANMVRKASQLGLIRVTEHGRYVTEIANSSNPKKHMQVSLPADIFADYLLNNNRAFNTFVLSMLTHDSDLDKINPGPKEE